MGKEEEDIYRIVLDNSRLKEIFSLPDLQKKIIMLAIESFQPEIITLEELSINSRVSLTDIQEAIDLLESKGFIIKSRRGFSGHSNPAPIIVNKGDPPDSPASMPRKLKSKKREEEKL